MTIPTQGEIVARMRAAMQLAEPNLDTSIGTVARKIFDVVAEGIGEAFADKYLLLYQYDIDSKIEGDLDDFVALFGFSRIPAQRATGTVTFTRPNDTAAATTSLIIPPGTQVVAVTNPLVYTQTMVSSVMAPGVTSTQIPVQAVLAGPQGNVAAGLLVNLVSSTAGISAVINAGPLSGGTAAESDTELRARFKRTVFRSLAGTQAMYEGVALEVPQAFDEPSSRANRRVNVIGSSKRRRERLQVTSGSATTTLTGAAYIYADNVFVAPDLELGNFVIPGSQFTFTPTNPTNGTDASAVLASVNGTAMPDGLYDVEYEYVSQACRNDPGNTRYGQGPVNNRVDIWIDGVILETATQSVIFSNSQLFSATSSNVLYNLLYTRGSGAGDNPPVGWIFIPLSFGPVLTLPDQIVISSVTYTEGVHYFLVERSDAFGYAPSSRYGIAWNPSSPPANGAAFSLTYTYNRAAADTQEAVRNWRLVGTDSQVHTGIPALLKFNLAIVYDRRFDVSAVNTGIDSALAEFINGISFGEPVQVSDVLTVVHNVPGVDNVRFLTSTDHATVYAISRMSRFNPAVQASVIASSGRAIDASFPENYYPQFHSTNIVIKGQNNFGQG